MCWGGNGTVKHSCSFRRHLKGVSSGGHGSGGGRKETVQGGLVFSVFFTSISQFLRSWRSKEEAKKTCRRCGACGRWRCWRWRCCWRRRRWLGARRRPRTSSAGSAPSRRGPSVSSKRRHQTKLLERSDGGLPLQRPATVVAGALGTPSCSNCPVGTPA